MNRTAGTLEDITMVLVAHAGHWLVNIAYFAPVIGFLVWLAVMQVRSRRATRNRG